MTPRTLAETRFTTGYPIVHYRPPMFDRVADVLLAVAMGLAGAVLAFLAWSA